jgi:hypothetical protein
MQLIQVVFTASQISWLLSRCTADYGLSRKSWPIVWNEFEVLDMRRFSQPDIKHFAAAVDATHRLYTHRRARFPTVPQSAWR